MANNTGVVFKQGDGVLYPVGDRRDKVMIVFSGSEGGLDHAEKVAKYLQDHGIPALALGYFKTQHSKKNLDRIPLELIKEVIDYLKEQGYQKIGIEGASKGAEYACAAAIAYPEISCVILKTPSWFYSEGMIGKRPSGTSCWTYNNQELPYTPYKERKLNAVQEMIKHREYNILAINTGKSIQPNSVIEIEKINAPILMFSTAVDTIWPSKESAEILEQRLVEHSFAYPHKHICFEHMSHMMLEYCGKQIKWFIKSERAFPEECARKRIEMGDACVHWIENIWSK